MEGDPLCVNFGQFGSREIRGGSRMLLLVWMRVGLNEVTMSMVHLINWLGVL